MAQHDQPAFLRLKQILGDKKAHPPIPAIIPISKASWFAGIAKGKYPKPVKVSRTALYKADDIQALLDAISKGELS
jgi:prophage regulatory protein